MNKIFYKPLESVMDERQRVINDAKSDALNSDNRANAILKDRDERLNKSLAESKKIVADKVNEANENSKMLTNSAKQKSQDEISTAKSSLKDEALKTTEELKSKVKDLAEVISAVEISDDRKQKLVEKLQNKLQKTVIPNWNVDKDIIGGLIIRIGDDVVDNSLRNKLENLSKNII